MKVDTVGYRVDLIDPGVAATVLRLAGSRGGYGRGTE